MRIALLLGRTALASSCQGLPWLSVSTSRKGSSSSSPFRRNLILSGPLLAKSPSSGCFYWRKGWDSNPRGACAPAGFQDQCIRPLCHPSAGRLHKISRPVQSTPLRIDSFAQVFQTVSAAGSYFSGLPCPPPPAGRRIQLNASFEIAPVISRSLRQDRAVNWFAAPPRPRIVPILPCPNKHSP
jgi:hypothetical protein